MQILKIDNLDRDWTCVIQFDIENDICTLNQIIILQEIKGSMGECLNARYFPIEWCFCAAGPTFGGSGQAGQGGPFVPSLPASTHHAKAI